MPNSDYWKIRFELLEEAMNDKSFDYIKSTEAIYRKAINNTEKEISRWYTRFAENEGVTYQRAVEMLTGDELKEFHMDVKEYIEKGKTLGVSDQWAKELERASTKVHISKLEALKLQMRQQVEILTSQKASGIDNLMRGIYQDSFYKTAYEIQKGFGVGSNFAKLDKKVIDKVLSKPWAADGSNFSQRIWGNHRAQLVNKLHEGLTVNLIQGKEPRGLINSIADTFQVDRKRAATLVYTEKAYFQSLAQRDSFKNLGVEEYEIVATLDTKTSKICQTMDGKHFKLDDFQVGLTAPPFHPRCRTATAPYFDDEFEDEVKRAARDEDGKYYTVPADMKYDDWYKGYVEGNEEYLSKIKKESNLYNDKELFNSMKEVLGGKYAPKSFDAFQDLKYNNTDKWDSLLNEYNVIKKIDEKDFTDEYKQKLKNVFYTLKNTGYDSGYHALGRIVGQKKSKGKREFTINELLDILSKPINYLEEPNRIVRFYTGIAVIQNADNGQIVSIVTRKNIKEGWKPYENK